MELSATIARIKRAETGCASLNDADRRHLRRADFKAIDCSLLTAIDTESCVTFDEFDVVNIARRSGHPVISVNLTRPEFGVAVFRAVCPGLQPFCETIIIPRLDACRVMPL
jgi:hypothetical protein